MVPWHCHLESFYAYGKFLRLKFQCKVSGLTGKFFYDPESVQMMWKVFDDLEKSLIMPKVSRQSSNILDSETISQRVFQCFENI